MPQACGIGALVCVAKRIPYQTFSASTPLYTDLGTSSK